jgi:DNA-binding Xre family transcriptional regulator
MLRCSRLIDELKRQLKARGLTYRKLAVSLSLSESAVKQMFAGENMSLQRLEAICEVIALDMGDLVLLCQSADKLEQLSVEQEAELVRDPELLVVAYCVVNNWSFDDIVATYRISEMQCIQKLALLDRMQLIELQPGNRIRVLVSGNFHWHVDGPIERYFRREVQGKFFNSSFDGEEALRVVRNGDISDQALRQIATRLTGIGQLFDDITRQERKLSQEQRHGTTMVLAIRHWQFSAFREFERQSAEG